MQFSWKKLSVFLILAVILLFFLQGMQILNPVHSVVTNILEPIQTKLYATSTTMRSWFSSDEENCNNENHKSLQEEVDRLAMENMQLQLALLKMTTTNEELEYLKDSFADHNFVLARVMSKDITSPSLIIINKGSNDDVEVGYGVIAGDGLLVGKVVETDDRVSKVLLLTHPRSSVAASIIRQDSGLFTISTQGIVSGMHGLSLIMNFIPKNIPVTYGDTIVTSGLENFIPEGLFIGEVQEVEDKSEELFKDAIILPKASFDTLDTVTILIPKTRFYD